MPKLSVIVPVYNTEKYLRECIDSILVQTFTDFELILVDDGSTDSSGAICDEYAKLDERVLVIHQENGGVTKARKTGVRCACGTYFSFIDSDDWIHMEMFERMIEKCDDTVVDIVVCDMNLEYNVRTESIQSLPEEGLYNKHELREKVYPTMMMDVRFRRPGILGSSCNKIIHRKVLEQVFWQIDDSFVYGEDSLFCYAALLESSSIYILHNPLYNYRQHSESVMHQYNGIKYYENALRSYYAFQRFLQNRGFDISYQLSGYISINAVDVIRRVLLYDKATALHVRFKQAVCFVSDPFVQASLSSNTTDLYSSRDKWKLTLVKKRRIAMLYILFVIRQFMLR